MTKIFFVTHSTEMPRSPGANLIGDLIGKWTNQTQGLFNLMIHDPDANTNEAMRTYYRNFSKYMVDEVEKVIFRDYTEDQMKAHKDWKDEEGDNLSKLVKMLEK